MDNSERHERLKSARIQAGFPTAKEAAARLKIPYGTYTGHESGTRGIKNAELMQYAKAFDVSPTWLAFGYELELGASLAAVFWEVKENGEIVGKGEEVHKVELLPGLPFRSELQAVAEVRAHLPGIAGDGSLIFFDISDWASDRAGNLVSTGEITDAKIGHLCLCDTDISKPIVIGTLHRGRSEGLFDIERTLLPTLRDVPVITAIPVIGVLPKYAATKLREREIPSYHYGLKANHLRRSILAKLSKR